MKKSIIALMLTLGLAIPFSAATAGQPVTAQIKAASAKEAGQAKAANAQQMATLRRLLAGANK